MSPDKICICQTLPRPGIQNLNIDYYRIYVNKPNVFTRKPYLYSLEVSGFIQEYINGLRHFKDTHSISVLFEIPTICLMCHIHTRTKVTYSEQKKIHLENCCILRNLCKEPIVNLPVTRCITRCMKKNISLCLGWSE